MNLTRYGTLLIFFLLNFLQSAHCKLKILALLPYNGKSHFYFAEVLFEELARRGHDVTVLSHYPRKQVLSNYHDISMANNATGGLHVIDMDKISSSFPLLEMMNFFSIGLHRVCEEGLAHPNVEKLINSHDHYDLLITEIFNADCFLGFVHKFKAPNVAIRTSSLSVWLSGRTGNPENPAYVPGTTLGNPSRMNFFQRLHNFIFYVTYKVVYEVYNWRCEQVSRKHFGNDMPSLNDIARNTSLYLVDSHFVHQYAKPLLPNVKDVAGLHVKEAKPLPKELGDWISGAKRGLVYLNLGSMIKPSSMSEEKKFAFFKAFAEFKDYRVLMKWDTEQTAGLPENVRLITWAPQNDVLHHANVKLFITHGGMLGSVESVHAGVPMIVIPFFGDQLTNAALLQERGLAVALRYADISFETLSRALHTILDDASFETRVRQLSAAFRDRPISPLQEAVYWIEYVARHHGTAAADLMRNAYADLHLFQYLLLDVILFISLFAFVACRVVKLFISLFKRKSKKEKKN